MSKQTHQADLQHLPGNEQLMRLTFNSSLEAIYILAAVWEKEAVVDFLIRDINKKAEEEMQMDRKGLVNKHNCKLFPINIENGYFEQYKEVYLFRKMLSQEYTVPEGYPGAGDYFQQIVPYSEGVIIYNRNNSELLAVTRDQNMRLRSFAYIVSHNIRSHSSNISGITNLLQTNLSDEDRSMFLNMLASSTNMLDQTINHLNEILTMQQTTGQLMETMDLRVEVEKTLSIFAQDLGLLQAQIINDIPENTQVRVVPAYLESILLNLLSNAIKYRDPDRPLKIHLFSSIFGQGVRLSITDNGLGIDLSRHSEHVFGMYKTFHGNPDARGFGLFLTKSQVEAMGGTIELDSEIGKVSTFKVTFYE
jgi:signal transduction histidine kinase